MFLFPRGWERSLLVTFIFASQPGWALSTNLNFGACLDKLEKEIQKDRDKLQTRYTGYDPIGGTIVPAKQIRFSRGVEGGGAVLLFHGIMNSPADLKLLADAFNAKGMTVLAPVIRGFGASVEVENRSTFMGWQTTVDKYYRRISECFEDISVVGFSLGGGLSTDFVLNRYRGIRANEDTATITSLMLLSPAIKPAEGFIRFKFEVTKPFTKKIPFWLVEKITHDPDIRHMMTYLDKKDQYFPIYVGINISHLRDALQASPTYDSRDVHVTLDYSEMDTATDWRETILFLNDRFPKVESFGYKPKDNVPHSLQLNLPTPVGDEIRSGLVKFALYKHRRFEALETRAVQILPPEPSAGELRFPSPPK